MGYAPKFFGCDGMDGILQVENFDTKLAEGLMLLTPFAADAQDELTQKFVTSYKENYGETPILNTLSEDASLEAPAAAVVASAAATAVVSVVEDELPQAVKEAAIASARLKLKTLFFIIDSSSGTCYHDNRSTLC